MKKLTAIIFMVICFIGGCALTLFLCVSLFVGAKMASNAASVPVDIPVTSPEDSPALSKAQEVYDTLNAMYIGEVDEDVMCDTVAEAMVYATGDRWSYYVPADAFDDYMEQMNNAYVGIGVTVQQTEDGRLVITEVAPEGPAYEAGVLMGDEFAAVDGTDCLGMSLTELRTLVKGEEGSKVSITFLRGDETIDFTIERRNIQTEVVSCHMIGDVGYIAIYNFDAGAGEKTIEAVQQMQAQGAKSLLFDVRFNPGGLKVELLEALDFLLPEGVLFRSKDFRGQEEIDSSDASCVDLPMAVLINQDSYSAAEFFAAALSEYGVAKTVGTQTCGKGYFQVLQPLSDGSAINISVGEYRTPNDFSLAEEGGLVPDVVLELDEEDLRQLAAHQLEEKDDEQLQKALELLK